MSKPSNHNKNYYTEITLKELEKLVRTAQKNKAPVDLSEKDISCLKGQPAKTVARILGVSEVSEIEQEAVSSLMLDNSRIYGVDFSECGSLYDCSIDSALFEDCVFPEGFNLYACNESEDTPAEFKGCNRVPAFSDTVRSLSPEQLEDYREYTGDEYFVDDEYLSDEELVEDMMSEDEPSLKSEPSQKTTKNEIPEQTKEPEVVISATNTEVAKTEPIYRKKDIIHEKEKTVKLAKEVHKAAAMLHSLRAKYVKRVGQRSEDYQEQDNQSKKLLDECNELSKRLDTLMELYVKEPDDNVNISEETMTRWMSGYSEAYEKLLKLRNQLDKIPTAYHNTGDKLHRKLGINLGATLGSLNTILEKIEVVKEAHLATKSIREEARSRVSSLLDIAEKDLSSGLSNGYGLECGKIVENASSYLSADQKENRRGMNVTANSKEHKAMLNKRTKFKDVFLDRDTTCMYGATILNDKSERVEASEQDKQDIAAYNELYRILNNDSKQIWKHLRKGEPFEVPANGTKWHVLFHPDTKKIEFIDMDKIAGVNKVLENGKVKPYNVVEDQPNICRMIKGYECRKATEFSAKLFAEYSKCLYNIRKDKYHLSGEKYNRIRKRFQKKWERQLDMQLSKGCSKEDLLVDTKTMKMPDILIPKDIRLMDIAKGVQASIDSVNQRFVERIDYKAGRINDPDKNSNRDTFQCRCDKILWDAFQRNRREDLMETKQYLKTTETEREAIDQTLLR